jgi:hypothetical protein
MGCDKETTPASPPVNTPPVIEYTDLHNEEIRSNKGPFFLDINKDGTRDIFFGTQLVGDPINQVDKLQFLVSSDILTYLPVNAGEEIPVLNSGAIIPLNDFDGFNWFELSFIVLIQKVIGFDGPVVWEGNWKTATKKYLPIQVRKNNLRFNGWIELTVDTLHEKIILHRAAISKAGEKEIIAGL